MQVRKKDPMLERLDHKGIDFLFKRQIDSDADGLGVPGSTKTLTVKPV
jgi:hypothetical protein